MSNFEYIVLDKSEERSISRFYEDLPTLGDFYFSISREPDFFEAIEVEGNDPEVFVMRRICSREIIGAIITSERECFINAKETSLGYISSLRLAQQYRNRLLGFYAKAFYCHQFERGRRISLMTIFEDNSVAKINLLSGKGMLPSMKDLGQIHTLIFKPVIRNEKEKKLTETEIRSANFEDIPMITDFLTKTGKDKTFFPVYRENHFNSDHGVLKNLKMKDIALAFYNGELSGVMGLWDQNEFRRWKIYDYSFRLKLLKPLINTHSWLMKKPLLPPSNKPFDYRNMALVCIRNNDHKVFNRLLQYHMNNLSKSNKVYIAYSMHESSPFLHNFPLPNIDFKSRLYLTYWKEDEAMLSSIIPGEIYLETGGL
jgi:hypothetical protein